ncbi:hypothetical protein BDZ91DRAFT_804590 [Kalaharituber pfeilii]|nr:hypothetical protein BDZ91DRAFT_804590 [Kalaharituber pfeilii]
MSAFLSSSSPSKISWTAVAAYGAPLPSSSSSSSRSAVPGGSLSPPPPTPLPSLAYIGAEDETPTTNGRRRIPLLPLPTRPKGLSRALRVPLAPSLLERMPRTEGQEKLSPLGQNGHRVEKKTNIQSLSSKDELSSSSPKYGGVS